MSGRNTIESETPAIRNGVRSHAGREEPPVRWPSAATGSGAAYGVSPVPASTDGGAIPDRAER